MILEKVLEKQKGNKKMYKCEECEAIFEEPKKYSEDCTPSGEFEGGNFMKNYKGCPYCRGNFDEYEEGEEE